jgi:hypothetical protein
VSRAILLPFGYIELLVAAPCQGKPLGSGEGRGGRVPPRSVGAQRGSAVPYEATHSTHRAASRVASARTLGGTEATLASVRSKDHARRPVEFKFAEF